MYNLGQVPIELLVGFMTIGKVFFSLVFLYSMTRLFKIKIGTLLREKQGSIDNYTQTTGMNPNVPGKWGHVIALCHLR